MVSRGMQFIADVHHKISHNKTKKGKINSLFKFFLKPCRNLLFFGSTKGGPHKSIFPPRFPTTQGFGSLRPRDVRWCGTLLTWNLFVPLMLLLAASGNESFWNMALWNIPGMANKHRTHEGAKSFQWFPGASNLLLMYTTKFHTIKRKKGKIKFLFKFFLKPCRNLLFFGATKGGPHKSIFPPRFPFYIRVRQLRATVTWYLINMELVCTTNVVASENESFWNMALWNFLGLANKHRNHGAKSFQWFPGACNFFGDVHHQISHNKTK